jgi:methylase of polypeptide subunit release factors
LTVAEYYPGHVSSAAGQPRVELAAELTAALGGNVGPWTRVLEEQPWTDPFRAIRANADAERELTAAVNAADLPAWLKQADQWVQSMHVPGHEPSAAERILWTAWRAFDTRLTRALARAREPARLPVQGGVLAFVDALNLCLVVDFRFIRDLPSLRVIDAIVAPRTVFDVLDAFLERPHETRTEIKGMLQSSHRLVWHRDVLVHIDRRAEPRVFGPSIDTLHLAEVLLSRYTFSPPENQPKRVLELGTGSGMLSASVLRNLPGVERLTGVEVDFASAVCTYRNWEINTLDRPDALERRAALVLGPFRPDLLAGSYDLVICNPPYIPEVPDAAAADLREGRRGAVAGLELLEQLLAISHLLVAPGGSLLLLVSSVTPRALVAAPDGFAAEWPWGDDGISVHFEVEDVFSRPAWLKRLVEAGGVSHSGAYYQHQLHAVWLTRTETR